MPVPEAAVNEDNLVARAENQIGSSGQIFRVQSVSVPEGKNEAPNEHLRASVTGADSCHDFRSLGRR